MSCIDSFFFCILFSLGGYVIMKVGEHHILVIDLIDNLSGFFNCFDDEIDFVM